MKLYAILITLILAASTSAQSGRAIKTVATDERPVKELFDEANNYRRIKYDEFEKKKIGVSKYLRDQTEKEQKQLAAKLAATAETRKDLSPDDLYYLALLHWIAENLDATSETLAKFLGQNDRTPERTQTARSLQVVVDAKQKKFDEATATLTEYQKSDPKKPSESLRMNSELAKAFLAEKQPEKAAPYAEEAFAVSRTLVADPTLRSVGLDMVYDNAMLAFDAHRLSNNIESAEKALENLRLTAASLGNSIFYFYGADKLITYRIETGRKPLALETYLSMLIAITKELPLEGQRADATKRLRNREKHYKLLGEPAPDFAAVDKWFPGTPVKIADLKGKVVLIDFWATWCAPCFDAFPSLIEWHTDLRDQGFEIIGFTRYYGQGEGRPVTEPEELAMLQRFKTKHKLPYDFVVGKDQSTQILYGATALPTAVLIDRKGVVRYIEAGTSSSRLVEMREMILKLLSEPGAVATGLQPASSGEAAPRTK